MLCIGEFGGKTILSVIIDGRNNCTPEHFSMGSAEILSNFQISQEEPNEFFSIQRVWCCYDIQEKQF